MRRAFSRPLSAVAVTCSFALMAVLFAGCGGGGGGGSGSIGSGSSSSSSGPDLGTVSVVDGSFQLKIKNVSSGQYLTISAQSQVAGAAIATGSDAGNKDTLWHVMDMGSSQYNVENLLTHQVAGITSASKTDGAAAVQWADNGTADHLWAFYKLTDGNYLIRNNNSGLYLQADSSGTVTQGARAASGTTQEWTITPTNVDAYPMPLTVSGAGTAVHDPNLIQDPSGKFWLYGTHNTLASSTDLTTWTSVSSGIFAADLSWWAALNTTGGNGRTDLWAPSVMYSGGTYYQYYSIPIYDTPSVAGSNNGAEAAIALATSTSPGGPWVDKGKIIESCGKKTGCTTTFNAIDPAPFVDASGKWWMVFGSWEDGTHIVQLDPATGLRLSSNATIYNVAARGAGEEGAFVLPRVVGGTQYYYYFASINVCCSGITSRYRVIVGRSTSPTGPFLDRGGLDLSNGGGTILISNHSYVYGPGGESAIDIGGQAYLVYHYYDGNNNGAPKLGLNKMYFDAAGWPYIQ